MGIAKLVRTLCRDQKGFKAIIDAIVLTAIALLIGFAMYRDR